MLVNNTESSTYKLFIALNIVVIVFTIGLFVDAWMPVAGFQFLANVILLALILLAFFFYGKFRFTPVRVFLFLLLLLLYLLRPGLLNIGVPIVPLIGLFLSIKKHNFILFKNLYLKKARIVSIASIAGVYFILYISKIYFGGNSDNLISIVALYVIALNILFFREAFFTTVIFAFVLSTLLTPANLDTHPILGIIHTHGGNRSGAFLLLFLLSMNNIKNLYSLFIKKKYFAWFIFALFPVVILILNIFNGFMARGNMLDVYTDPRFQWFMPLLQLLINEGLISFFDNGSDLLYELGDGRRNPHNSFFYLLLEQYWVGLFKILLFIFSIFVIPFSAWLAIAGRASFDIFFLLGPVDIIFVILLSNFSKLRVKKIYNPNLSK